MKRALVVVSLLALAACSGPTGGNDAGTGGGGGHGGGGATGGGSGGGTGGGGGGGTGGGSGGGDAGTDAGCSGIARQLAFTSAVQTVAPNTCSTAFTVQLQDECGAPVNAASAITLTLTSSAATASFYSDQSCATVASTVTIGAGASIAAFSLKDTAVGAPTVTAAASGLTSASQQYTVACQGTDKLCNGACIPQANCCTATDCSTEPNWQCANGQCVAPACATGVNTCPSFADAGTGSTVSIVGLGYSPRCIHISPNDMVTIQASGLHPLEQTCGAADMKMRSTSDKTFTFTQPGLYGFDCQNHKNTANMRGAILVQ